MVALAHVFGRFIELRITRGAVPMRALPQIRKSSFVALPPLVAAESKLFLNERVEHCGPLAFEVSILLETPLKQSFDSPQRLRPG